MRGVPPGADIFPKFCSPDIVRKRYAKSGYLEKKSRMFMWQKKCVVHSSCTRRCR
jgi:hypothetical protein